MEGNGIEDGFIIMRTSLIQRLLDMKCEGCGSRNFHSQLQSALALVTVFYVRCQDCGWQEYVDTSPKTVEEFRQVDRLIIDYALNSKGGRQEIRELLKMKTKKETVKDMEVHEDVDLKEEIDIKEETQEFDDLKPIDEQEVQNTAETSAETVKSKDKRTRDDDVIPVHMKTSQATRTSIISLHGAGLSNGEIARTLDISRNTVALWIKRFEESGTILNKPRSGRPRCTTTEEDEVIRAVITNDPFATAATIREKHGISCTLQTIRNRLHSIDWHGCQPRKKPALSQSIMEKRLAYALEYADRPSSFWDNVIFCSEKTFCSDDGRTTIVRHKQNTRFKSEHVVGNRRSGRVCADLFGWIHAGGVGELVDIGPGQFTEKRYVEILEEVLLPSAKAMLFPGSTPFHLVQDNSPIHTAKVVKAWFKEHPEITVLVHPPKSPDLNPIEQIWAAMKEKIGSENQIHCSRSGVVDKAMMSWEQLRSPAGRALTEELVSSMPRRLNSIIEAEGACARY